MSIAKETPASPDEKLVSQFLGGNQILIADTVSSARVNLASQLVQMGAKRTSMGLVASYEEAQRYIQDNKPKIILCDFMLGKLSGLDLIQEQKLVYDAKIVKDCFFVLVTANGSQSTVARAAEEDVDAFILKPFTLQSLRKNIIQSVLIKLRPSAYLTKVEQAKELLFSGAIDEAVVLLNEAMSLDPTPTLACFYLAQANVMKSALNDADGSYRKGLAFNKIHYKCLVGLYELMMKEKKTKDAYDVVKRLAQYFPANPKRLSAVLRLAVSTESYEDIEGYYRLFTALDSRPDELVKYMCSAMAITGKYYLKQKSTSRALEIFDRVAVSCAGRTGFIRYIVETLIEYDLADEAARHLKRFEPHTYLQEDYLVASYQLLSVLRPAPEAVEHGRTLLQKGFEFPGVYKLLIKHAHSVGLEDLTEELISKASKKWADQSDEFHKIITT